MDGNRNFRVPDLIDRLNLARQQTLHAWGYCRRMWYIEDLSLDRIKTLTESSGELGCAFGVVLFELSLRLKKTGSVDSNLWRLFELIVGRFRVVHKDKGGNVQPVYAVSMAHQVSVSGYNTFAHSMQVAYRVRLAWEEFHEKVYSATEEDQRRIIEILVPMS